MPVACPGEAVGATRTVATVVDRVLVVGGAVGRSTGCVVVTGATTVVVVVGSSVVVVAVVVVTDGAFFFLVGSISCIATNTVLCGWFDTLGTISFEVPRTAAAVAVEFQNPAHQHGFTFRQYAGGGHLRGLRAAGGRSGGGLHASDIASESSAAPLPGSYCGLALLHKSAKNTSFAADMLLE